MRTNQKGFTLIEMMVVVALLAITVGVTSDILISLVRTNTKTQVLNEIEQQANFVSLKIEKELRDARLISQPENGGSGNTLEFQTKDGSTVTYSLGTDSRVLMRTVTGVNLPVTWDGSPGGVAVSCGGNCFEVIGSSPQVVKINMTFRQAQDEAGVSYSGEAKIESSIVVRSTY